MTPDSTGKNINTMIPGRLSVFVATSATARLRVAFLVPLAGAIAAFFVIGMVALYMHEHEMVEGDVSRAQTLVQRMYRDDVAHNAQSLDVNADVPLRITVSIGVASFPAHADSEQALVAAADAALYAAKASGRNRISRFEPAPGQAEVQG